MIRRMWLDLSGELDLRASIWLTLLLTMFVSMLKLHGMYLRHEFIWQKVITGR